MDSKKERLLKQVYDAYINLMVYDFPIERIGELAVEDVSGYGTTGDEKILEIKRLEKIVRDQREQGGGLEMPLRMTPVHRRISPGEDIVIYMDEVEITLLVDDAKNVIPLRLTSIFEFNENTWKLVHLHGSKAVETEGDTWHLDEWKRKSEELQKLVDQKTFELEKKNRELEIEAALERVRAVAMGMNKLDDLLSICETSFFEFKNLGFENLRNAVIHIPNDDQKYFMDCDFSDYTGGQIGKVDYGLHPIVDEYLEKIRSAKDAFFELVIADDMMDSWNDFRRKSGQMYDQRLDNAKALYYYLFSIGTGDIGISTFKPITDAQIETLKRFRNVFDLTYHRYTDIALAEAQTREAQIEVALERVRARTMAMHSSKELSGVASVLFEQMNILGGDLFAFGIVLCDKYEDMVEQWHSIGEEGMMKPFQIPVNLDYIHQYRYDKWKSGEKLFSIEIPEDYIDRHFELMFEIPSFKVSMADVAAKGINITIPGWEIDYGASFSHGYLLISSLKPFKEDYIFPRFARVFEQAYTRFLDLLKAEAATREARIEASLERIRSKALSMQKSSEVGDMNDLLFDEFEKMSIEMVGCGISVINEETDYCEQWRARQLGTVDSFEIYSYKRSNQILNNNVPEIHGQFMKAWENGVPFCKLDLKGTQRDLYIKSIAELFDYDKSKQKNLLSSLPESFIIYFIYYKKGWLSLSTIEQLTEEEINFSRRFVEAFDFAHTRFLDLKQAEDQAREAVKQASLDRIRGQIASMRNTQDLQQITPLIWQELITLEIPFFRCGIFIIDEKKKKVEVYLTTPEGKPLGVLNLATGENQHIKNTVDSWRQNEVYQVHWSKKQFTEWTSEMMRLGQINSSESYQDATEPPESLYLHFIPFAQGMLYVGNYNLLEKEKIKLLGSMADTFSFAYARYEDFVVLEEAKDRVEKALNKLKATQTQLIHAEKMASLGELTAGIAHEIQNPLNFVNNFSEVSVDLIEEMYEEMEAGDLEEVKAIAEDLKQNLEKISNHGQRASSIVKGMLEHSRSGSGAKVPTNINAIADEYLRLAYHGLRAKDKSFNADFKLELDKNLPKVEVVPQDIGRVLLNLINNAFYACTERSRSERSRSERSRSERSRSERSRSERSRSAVHDKTRSGLQALSEFEKGETYNPTVTIITKNLGDKIQIRVSDNGNGIPGDVLKKIFQPFFTTKPTGEGTGLGLSMSYDIITKGHSGKLEVETKEGEGTTFIINIPMLK